MFLRSRDLKRPDDKEDEGEELKKKAVRNFVDPRCFNLRSLLYTFLRNKIHYPLDKIICMNFLILIFPLIFDYTAKMKQLFSI